jgi:hypothetical protein
MSVRPWVQEGYSRSEQVFYVAGHDAEVMRRRRRTEPLSAGDGCWKATSEPARPPQRPELTCGAFPCSVDLIP